MEVITKRLHVSGLTPAISQEDLQNRLASFGQVKAMDGFGKLNGLEQLNKFGYVTIETTKAKLAKCLNLLSGSTWKGAKLRIGEAKPDFRERLSLERQIDEAPTRKRRRTNATLAADMSLVTTETANIRSGWQVTPMGRVVRPVRMRPVRPLPAVQSPDAKAKMKKQKYSVPPSRARRRMIDPIKWGSIHLKDIFLNPHYVAHNPTLLSGSELRREKLRQPTRVDENQLPKDVISHEEPIPGPPLAIVEASRRNSLGDVEYTSEGFDISQEKVQSLGILQSLFGDGEDWGGRESIGSDQDEGGVPVPSLSTDRAVTQEQFRHVRDEEYENMEPGSPMEYAVVDTEDAPQQSPQDTQLKNTSGPTNLKELFAPRAEEAGFSLVGHLALDLDLDDIDNPLDLSEDIPAVGREDYVAAPAVEPPPTSQITRPVFDPYQPLFFPSFSEGEKGKARDVMDVARENGWDWREGRFYRTESEAEIRQRWEGVKVDLTRDWKRRHREAVKLSKRRGRDTAD